MDSVHPLEIPAKHIEFARELAALADKYSMDRLVVEYQPSFRESGIEGCFVHGNAKILYSSTDRRGRLCRNLSIHFDSVVDHSIIKNQESTS